MIREAVIVSDVEPQHTVIEFDPAFENYLVVGINPHTPPGCSGIVYDEIIWIANGNVTRAIEPTIAKAYPAGTKAQVLGIALPEEHEQ